MNDVRMSLEGSTVIDGAPIPLTFRQAVSWLEHRNYLKSARYCSQLWEADTAGLDPDLAEFVRVFQRHMANLGIPVHADVAYVSAATQARLYVLGIADVPAGSVYQTGRAVSLVHSVRGRQLPPIAWAVFSHVGHEVASRLGLAVSDRLPLEPWLWELDVL